MTENELLDELEKEYKIHDRKIGDVISSDMSSKTGLSEHQCESILYKKFKAGELDRYKVMNITGHPVYAYCKKDV